MTEQTIPADKVRELAELARQHNSESNPYLQANLANEICNRLQAYLPDPPQPTTGLLGRWAKHTEHGDVMCGWGKAMDGWINVHKRVDNDVTGVKVHQVHLDSLTFPHQATKPEDVPAGEAWLVNVEDSEESHKSIVALKDEHDAWRVCGELMTDFFWRDQEVTLIAPLTPERPVSDLQAKSTERALDRMKAKYDELNAKYREAQERIKALEQPAWRIEHYWQNLKAGEYAIDKEGYDGIIRRKSNDGSYWLTDESWVFFPEYAPFIVFPSVDAATPEAVAEAKRARDKETGE